MTAELKPVSAVLEADLRTWVQRHGIVMWLDGDGHYTAFVDRLGEARRAGLLPYDVRAFRGSHLELMLSLDGLTGGAARPALVIHLPGFNEDTVRETPLLELYESGIRYRKALGTLIGEAAAGQVPPADIEVFAKSEGLTLDAADRWFESRLAGRDDGLDGWLRNLTPIRLLEEVFAGGGRVLGYEQSDVLWDRLAAWTGLPETWRAQTMPAVGATPDAVAVALSSWVMCVEYGNDLKRPPVNAHLGGVQVLPRAVIDTCREVATWLRDRHATKYQRIADETESFLEDERRTTKAEDLGRIDTFRFEEDKVLDAALDALGARAWDRAAAWAMPRVEGAGQSAAFWLQRDPLRRSTWFLVREAASLGQALNQAGRNLAPVTSLESALALYVERGSPVDHAHRHLEQRRAALLDPQLPEFGRLRARLDDMRLAWREWADHWARDFNGLCRATGFVPPAGLQQRTLFDEVVKPLAQESGTTALFVIDAFRFEMGVELHTLLADPAATNVSLKARFAELPTVTEVGMNVLAPVHGGGRLSPAFAAGDGDRIVGFSTGEFRVIDPDSRRRAMQDRVGGSTCPWLQLDDVLSRDATSLRRTVAQARLVVVHSREIDKAGEEGLGAVVFDRVMQNLRSAWQLLREAGVRRFVFTSDHGFLLLDDHVGTAQKHGRRVDPKRRHVISPVGANHTGEVRVSLADLGYSGAEAHLMMPETTAVFDTGRVAASFVHGGNSLQERVIPVLTVVHRAAAGGGAAEYRVSARPLDGVAGMHCLEIRFDLAQTALDFGTPTDVELTLGVLDASDVEVELCQTRGAARVVGGAVQATVGKMFEIFFRLVGRAEQRLFVQLRYPGGTTDISDTRFVVTASGRTVEGAAHVPTMSADSVWLESLPEGGERLVFAHIAAHDAITEQEAAVMLGGPRGLRRFANRFEELARKAPFIVRIDVVGGVKRYVREGTNR